MQELYWGREHDAPLTPDKEERKERKKGLKEFPTATEFQPG